MNTSNKFHAMCKSKTLDVPIIITTNDFDLCDQQQQQQQQQQLLLQPNGLSTSLNNKFQKGYSLDSQHMFSQNSLSSSSSLAADLTSSSNSISSSNNSITAANQQQPAQYRQQQFLQPPCSLSTTQVHNINADFYLDQRVSERCPPPTANAATRYTQ